MWVLVEVLHIRVCGSRVEVEVVLLHVLAMVALIPRQTENPFFQDGIALVPESHSKANVLFPVADSRQSVFVPAIST